MQLTANQAAMAANQAAMAADQAAMAANQAAIAAKLSHGCQGTSVICKVLLELGQTKVCDPGCWQCALQDRAKG